MSPAADLKARGRARYERRFARLARPEPKPKKKREPRSPRELLIGDAAKVIERLFPQRRLGGGYGHGAALAMVAAALAGKDSRKRKRMRKRGARS